MEEVEVADQSLQASLNDTRDDEEHAGGRRGGMNVSLAAMSLSDEEVPQDATDLSMDDLAAADELECDVSSEVMSARNVVDALNYRAPCCFELAIKVKFQLACINTAPIAVLCHNSFNSC